jgi:uncharacterized membrane protein YkvI
MKHSLYLVLAFCLVTLSGCQAIADIFKAGVWVGIIIVVVVIFLVVFLIGKSKK